MNDQINLPTKAEIVEERSNIIVDESTPVLKPRQSFEDMLAKAIENKEGMEVMQLIKDMYELQLKEKDRVAKEAYFKALSEFHAMEFFIKKDKFNTQFKTKAHPNGTPYTSLESLLNTCRPYLGKVGLSPSFPNAVQDEKTMTVTCRITHSLGHSEEMSMKAPVLSSPVGKTSGMASMNPIQSIKGTFTYLRSATFEGVLGLAGSEATIDDDGNSAGEFEEKLNDQQHADIIALLQEIGKSEQAFCKYKKVKSINDLASSKFEAIIKELEGWRK